MHNHLLGYLNVRTGSIRNREMSDEPVRLERQLLTAREVAELLRLPGSTVYELARTERLPHLRIGRAMRFSREDLETYLADVYRSVPRRRRAELA
jgi:excisionase family DNA binding protein